MTTNLDKNDYKSEKKLQFWEEKIKIEMGLQIGARGITNYLFSAGGMDPIICIFLFTHLCAFR